MSPPIFIHRINTPGFQQTVKAETHDAKNHCDKSPRLHCCCDKSLALILSLRYRFEFVRQMAATMIFTGHTRRFVAVTCRGEVSQRFVASCVSALIDFTVKWCRCNRTRMVYGKYFLCRPQLKEWTLCLAPLTYRE